MSWNFREPEREDFDTQEEYQEALDAYYASEDAYVDAYVERCQENR